MIDIELINGYVAWKRDKDLYPPKWTPEEYAEYIKQMRAVEGVYQINEILEEGSSDYESVVERVREVIDGIE